MARRYLAVVGMPGESSHNWLWFADRALAESWLQREFEGQRKVSPQRVPASRILSETAASRVKYRDGNLVYGFREHGQFWPAESPIETREELEDYYRAIRSGIS